MSRLKVFYRRTLYVWANFIRTKLLLELVAGDHYSALSRGTVLSDGEGRDMSGFYLPNQPSTQSILCYV